MGLDALDIVRDFIVVCGILVLVVFAAFRLQGGCGPEGILLMLVFQMPMLLKVQ